MTIINSVIAQGGIQPSGTLNITLNDTYDVTNYASAVVNVPTTAPSRYLEYQVNSTTGNIEHSKSVTSIINLDSALGIGAYVFYEAYAGCTSLTGNIDFKSIRKIHGINACTSMFVNCTGITSVDLSSLVIISGSSSCQYMFQNCPGITSVDLSSLKYITGQNGATYMFNGCSGITSLDLSSVIKISNNYACSNMFYGCTSLTTVDLSSLLYVPNQYACSSMFYGCTSLTTVDISNVIKIREASAFGNMFQNCTSLTSLSFPNLPYTTYNFNNSFINMLNGVTGCTVHFPAEWQTDMASWSNVTAGFGGTNTTVLFDLPNKTTLDLTILTRIEGDTTTPNSLFSQFAQGNYFPNITKVDLSNLVYLSGNYTFNQAFKDCTNLTSFDLSALETIHASDSNSPVTAMFRGCTGLTTVDLHSLTTVSGNSYAMNGMFTNCTGITSVDLSSLEEVTSNNAFTYTFSGCTSLTSLSFPALKTIVNNGVFNNMLDGVIGCTVHFPSNLSSYNFNCGGTSTTVVYDLPATN